MNTSGAAKWQRGAKRPPVVAVVTLAAAALTAIIVVLRQEWLSKSEIDVLAKALAGLGIVVAAGWAVVTYATNKRLEFQKSFNDRQLEIVLLTAQAVGDLLASQEGDWDSAKARFWELYWGRLVLFEDKPIVNAMIALGNDLSSTSFKERIRLQSKVYNVSLALRNFLKERNAEDWKISFADIKEAQSRRTAGGDANLKL
ncbi:MAG: hypothetical protein FJX62_11140 [Alphaproteobacteria bacterium]|nr:hypothetical protein [Alphaproteobacteria bacterium]